MDLHIVSPKDFEKYGIDPKDVPHSMVVSLDQPPMMKSRYGGNAYGLGFLEFLQKREERARSFKDQVQDTHRPEYLRINSYYKEQGLLIRVTKELKRYYLVPIQIAYQYNTEFKVQIQSVIDMITRYKGHHYKEQIRIGILAQDNSLLYNEIKMKFVEDDVESISTLEHLRSLRREFDLLILPENLTKWLSRNLRKDMVDDKTNSHKDWVIYLLNKIYNVLSEEGNLIIFNRKVWEKDTRLVTMKFTNLLEAKRFMLYSKIYDTKFSYSVFPIEIRIDPSELYHYITRYYSFMDLDIVRTLLGDKDIESASIEEINRYQPLNYDRTPLLKLRQRDLIERYIPIFFNELQKEELSPQEVREYWERRFTLPDGWPDEFFLSFICKARPSRGHVQIHIRALDEDVLRGCRRELVADYRDSFEYVIKVLNVVEGLRHHDYPQVLKQHSDRLRLPLQSRSRRHRFLEDVQRLIKKKARLEKLNRSLNPGNIEGAFTSILGNLNALYLMGFEPRELSELLRITVGHSAMGRILLGKLHEERLLPVLEYARALGPDEGLNLFRYLRLMTAAELEASMGRPVSRSQMEELFDLFERCARSIASPGISGHELELKGELFSGEAIKSTVIKRILKLMGYHDLLSSAEDLVRKGEMELEVLSEFDGSNLKKIMAACSLVELVQHLMEKFWERGTGFEEFATRLMDCEFHGTGRLFQQVQVKVILSLLWITLGCCNEKIVSFNPVLKGLDVKEAEKRVKKIERTMTRQDFLNIPWPDLEPLKEQLYKRGSTFVPGTGLMLTLDPGLGALMVDYYDVGRDLSRCVIQLQRVTSGPVEALPPHMLKDLHDLLRRLNLYKESHHQVERESSRTISRIPSWQWKRNERVEDVINRARLWLYDRFLDPFQPLDRLRQLELAGPSLLSFFLNIKDQLLIQEISQAFRMYQALVRGDAAGFYDPKVITLRIHQEFGMSGTGEMGASLDELSIVAERFRPVLEDEEILRGVLLSLLCLAKERYMLPKGGVREFLGPDLDPLIPKSCLKVSEEILRGAHIFLGYIAGSHTFQHVIEEKDKGHIFLAAFVTAMIFTQAFDQKTISHDFLSAHLYPLLPLLPADEKAVSKSTQDMAMGRLFKLKGLLYVDLNDVLKFLDKTLPRYICVTKGMLDVSVLTFEKELYEASRIYKAFMNVPETHKRNIIDWLCEPIILIGLSRILSYLTYENQFKFIYLIASVSRKSNIIKPTIRLDYLERNIDIVYEKINDELRKMDYSSIPNGNLPSIFISEIDPEKSEISLHFSTDVELAHMARELDKIEDIDKLKQAYFNIIKKASESYLLTDRIESELDRFYSSRLSRLSEEKISSLSRELKYISDLTALKEYLQTTLEMVWDIGLPREAIGSIEKMFEGRLAELRLRKLEEIKQILREIRGVKELGAYWEEVKAFLRKNRSSLGKDYLLLVARLFDDARSRLGQESNQP